MLCMHAVAPPITYLSDVLAPLLRNHLHLDIQVGTLFAVSFLALFVEELFPFLPFSRRGFFLSCPFRGGAFSFLALFVEEHFPFLPFSWRSLLMLGTKMATFLNGCGECVPMSPQYFLIHLPLLPHLFLKSICAQAARYKKHTVVH